MPSVRHCAKCGAELTSIGSEPLCPNCLLSGGLAETLGPTSADSISQPADPVRRSFGDYELLEEVGRGGMGIVYKARQASLDRSVAVKMLLFGALASKEFIQRFRAEATTAGSLQHPNIVAIHEVGIYQAEHYLVMDYVAGRSLAEIVRDGPLEARRAARYLQIIAEAVHYAHERGVLHRDLKPSNILIDSDDKPKLTDFGLAKRLEKETELTLSGQVLGSPNYMSPEQAAAKRGQVGRRSDVYSLGAVLYHLLTGRPPFVAQSVAETLQAALHQEPVSPQVLNPSVPRDLETVCLKCLEKEPLRRYQTAQELAGELERFGNHEPIHAWPVNAPERLWRWCRRKPVIAALSATTALLLLAVAIGSPIALVRINHEKLRAEQTAEARRLDLYVADMKVAHLALQEGNRGLAIERLRKYLPQFGVPASAGNAPDRQKAEPQTDLRGFEWRYLWKRCEGEELFTLRGHSNRVVSVAFDRTGTWLASSSDDETVRIWNVDRREPVSVLPIADRVLTSVAFSPNNNALAVGGGRGVRIREGSGWNSERFLTNAHGPLVFAPGGRTLVTDGHEGMMFWDTATWQLVRQLDDLHASRFSEHISNPVFSRDGTRFALASYEEVPGGRRMLLRVWPFATLMAAGLEGSPSILLNPGTNALAIVQALRFSPDGQLLAAGDWDGFIGLWETASGKLLASTNVAAVITGFVFLADGQTLASTTSDQHLSVWDYSSLTNLTLVGRRQGHDHELWAAALSPNGQLLATGGKDTTVKFWDAPSLRTARRDQAEVELPLEHGPMWISHDGRRIATVSLDSDLTSEKLIKLLDVSRVSFVDTATLATLDSISFTASFQFVALTTNGQRLAVGRTNGMVEIWDVANKQRPLSTLKGSVDDSLFAWKRTAFHWKFILHEVWSPDGNRLVTFWPRVKVWDVNTGLGRELPVHGDAIAAGFSPDGTTLAVALSESVELWNSQTGQRITVCKGRMTSTFTFSRDGRMLIGSENEKAWIWAVPSGKLLGTLTGHSLWFDHIAFSADGQTIATHLGGSFTLWNVRNGQELFSLKMGRLGYGRVLFSGDGGTLIVHKDKRPALVLSAPSLEIADAERSRF